MSLIKKRIIGFLLMSPTIILALWGLHQIFLAFWSIEIIRVFMISITLGVGVMFIIGFALLSDYI